MSDIFHVGGGQAASGRAPPTELAVLCQKYTEEDGLQVCFGKGYCEYGMVGCVCTDPRFEGEYCDGENVDFVAAATALQASALMLFVAMMNTAYLLF